MGTVRVHCVLATTHAIPAYGGIRLGEEVMHDLATAVADGSMPMHFNHDISRPVHVSNVVTGVERRPHGEHAA
jgi:hypothetical protein